MRGVEPAAARPTLRVGSPPAAFPVDPCFPQLEVAGDPERMREIFRVHLKPVGGRSLRILDCVPFRFRCRQSTSRCVLQFTLRLEEPETGRQWDQWVTGLIYAAPGEAERLWRTLAATDPVPEVPEGWRTFEPVSFIRELDMLIEVFPYDRRIPQLGRVLEAAVHELEPRLLGRLGPGRWRRALPSIEPTRYRTEMGAVLRCDLQALEVGTGRGERLRYYLKVYRDGHGEETFAHLRSWSLHPRAAFGLVRPVEFWSGLRTLVLEEAPGTSLKELLGREDDPVDAVRESARAAAAFNQDELGVTRAHPLRDQLEQLKRAADLVAWACPELETAVREVTSTLAANLGEVPPKTIHGDLKPDHIFLFEGRAIFVDLDSVALGDPVRDPAHFCSYVLARVGLEKLSVARARALAGEFADSYFSAVPRGWRQRFTLHCAGALIEVAGGIFRHQRARWRERATAAVEDALRMLSGGDT